MVCGDFPHSMRTFTRAAGRKQRSSTCSFHHATGNFSKSSAETLAIDELAGRVIDASDHGRQTKSDPGRIKVGSMWKANGDHHGEDSADVLHITLKWLMTTSDLISV